MEEFMALVVYWVLEKKRNLVNPEEMSELVF
jgi:hypothetical protein